VSNPSAIKRQEKEEGKWLRPPSKKWSTNSVTYVEVVRGSCGNLEER